MPGTFVSTTRRSFGVDDNTPITGQRVEVGSQKIEIKAVFGAGSVDQPYTISFNYADVQAFALKSNVDLTIKTNSTTSPGNTINLKAGSVFEWSKSDAYFANPFTANVTVWYVTCASAAQLTGVILKV